MTPDVPWFVPEPTLGTGVQAAREDYGRAMSQSFPPYSSGQPVPISPSEQTWGGAAHWSAFLGAWLALAFLGPLVVLLVKGNESPYVRRQAVEALNFQLSILIYGIVSVILMLLLVGFLLFALVCVMWLVFTIIGSVKAAQGEIYRYPLTLRLVH